MKPNKTAAWIAVLLVAIAAGCKAAEAAGLLPGLGWAAVAIAAVNALVPVLQPKAAKSPDSTPTMKELP